MNTILKHAILVVILSILSISSSYSYTKMTTPNGDVYYNYHSGIQASWKFDCTKIFGDGSVQNNYSCIDAGNECEKWDWLCENSCVFSNPNNIPLCYQEELQWINAHSPEMLDALYGYYQMVTYCQENNLPAPPTPTNPTMTIQVYPWGE